MNQALASSADQTRILPFLAFADCATGNIFKHGMYHHYFCNTQKN